MAAMLVYTTKECNYNSIVIVHQQCGYDVTCKPRICRIKARSAALTDHYNSILTCLAITKTVIARFARNLGKRGYMRNRMGLTDY